MLPARAGTERAVLAGAIAVLLFCVAALLRAGTPVPVARITAGAPDGAYTALVVFQEQDCESNLGFLDLFQRPKLRPHFREHGLLLASGRLRDRRLEERIRGALPGFRFRRGTGREWRTFAAMGFRQTPFLVVVDGAGQVRYASPAPSGPTDYVRLARDLQALADAAPSAAFPAHRHPIIQ